MPDRHSQCIFDENIEDCCIFPNETNEADTKAVVDECDKEFASKHDFKCAEECFLNKTKVLVNGKIDKQNAIGLGKFEPADEATWNPILKNAVEKCTTWAEDEAEHAKEPGCSIKSAFFVNCIMAQMFVVRITLDSCFLASWLIVFLLHFRIVQQNFGAQNLHVKRPRQQLRSVRL